MRSGRVVKELCEGRELSMIYQYVLMCSYCIRKGRTEDLIVQQGMCT